MWGWMRQAKGMLGFVALQRETIGVTVMQRERLEGAPDFVRKGFSVRQMNSEINLSLIDPREEEAISTVTGLH
jgi:hypothetical protein